MSTAEQKNGVQANGWGISLRQQHCTVGSRSVNVFSVSWLYGGGASTEPAPAAAASRHNLSRPGGKPWSQGSRSWGMVKHSPPMTVSPRKDPSEIPCAHYMGTGLLTAKDFSLVCVCQVKALRLQTGMLARRARYVQG